MRFKSTRGSAPSARNFEDGKKPASQQGSGRGQELVSQPAGKQSSGNKFLVAKRLDSASQLFKYRKNRSADLIPLKRDYDVMRKKLRSLASTTKKYAEALSAMEDARSQVTKNISEISHGSPLHDLVGKDERGRTDSIASLMRETCEVDKKYVEAYTTDVVEYTVEWEREVTTRIDREIKINMSDQKKMMHYQTKVEGLRKKINDIESKGTSSPSDALTEKLERNDGKLKEAWDKHETSSSTLADLIEEVTTRGWKDLYPLLVSVTEIDSKRVGTYHSIQKRFQTVKGRLDEDFRRYNAKKPESPSLDEGEFPSEPFAPDGGSDISSGG